jgi:lipopolysaccharide transport system permease protein
VTRVASDTEVPLLAAERPAHRGADTRVIRIVPTTGWAALRLGELWDSRELLFFMVWRDVKVKYKQTAVGVLWAIFQPFLMMLLFVTVFGRIASFKPPGVPYAVFVYSGLLPWTLFATSLANTSASLLANQVLVTKVYVPRLLIPLAATMNGVVDFCLAFVVLLGVMAFYGVAPAITALLIPLFILLVVLTSLAVGLWLSALNVRYRDIQYVLPFIVQLWFFVTPVLYQASQVLPARLKIVWELNPMYGVLQGFRWALLGNSAGVGPSAFISAAVVLVLLVGGLMYFRRTEKSFADLI